MGKLLSIKNIYRSVNGKIIIKINGFERNNILRKLVDDDVA